MMIAGTKANGGFPARRTRPRCRVARTTRAGCAPRIRTELEEVADENERKQPIADSQKRVIALENISLSFEEPILENISFDAKEGETVVVVGESGTGKSTILKLVLRLLIPDKGRVSIDDEDITHLTFDDALKVRQKMGMVFQGAALFDSMTVYENVAYPLREHTTLSEDEIEARVREKLQFVDLEPEKVMDQMPSELSGGMKKRVGSRARSRQQSGDHALRRADVGPRSAHVRPQLLTLSSSSSASLASPASWFRTTSDRLSAWRARCALLANRHIGFFGTPEEMTGSDDPYIREFLGGFLTLW